MKLEPFIRDVPDFPKPGIVFKDITPLLASPDAFRVAIDQFAGIAESLAPDAIVAIAARRAAARSFRSGAQAGEAPAHDDP